MCLLGARRNFFDDILNQSKWEIEIVQQLCLSEQAEIINSANPFIFKDFKVHFDFFRLFLHSFCYLEQEIFYMKVLVLLVSLKG